MIVIFILILLLLNNSEVETFTLLLNMQGMPTEQYSWYTLFQKYYEGNPNILDGIKKWPEIDGIKKWPSPEYIQHFDMIINFYIHTKEVYPNWIYCPITIPGGGSSIAYLADAAFYNIETRESILLQYKYRGVSMLNYATLNKLCWNYGTNADILHIGYVFNDVYENQVVYLKEFRHKIWLHIKYAGL